MNIRLNDTDIDLILEALANSAARKESQARVVKHGRHHDLKAKRMREIRLALMNQRAGATA